MATGFAFGNKLSGNSEIGMVFIGDGTLGEGVVYESLNFISKNNVPLIVVCENNYYAQSTQATTTTAGTIKNRALAFDIEFRESDTFDGDTSIFEDAKNSIDFVRKHQKPIFHLVNTYRLKAHSKGDDDRDLKEIEEYSQRDFLSIFKQKDPKRYEEFYTPIYDEVQNFIEFAKAQEELSIKEYLETEDTVKIIDSNELIDLSSERLVTRINGVLKSLLRDSKTLLIGEDIVDPYGGAFKITKGLGDDFSEQIIPTGISEGLIAGLSNGLALRGFKPIPEFMFGDFTALAFDQMLNHAAKVYNMYNKKVTCGVIYRTPMGGGRGYGPTHSQSLEKHFLGMDTFYILAVNRISDPTEIYTFASNRIHPTLIIENKVDYGKNGKLSLPLGYKIIEHKTNTLSLLTIEAAASTDTAIITYGGMLDEAISKLEELIVEGDIVPKIIITQQLDPFPEAICGLIGECETIVFLEEGIEGGSVGDYFISKIAQRLKGHRTYRSITSLRTAIPSVKSLEKAVKGELNINSIV